MLPTKTITTLALMLFIASGNVHADKEARLKRISAEERAYWFFQPLAKTSPPSTANSAWSKNEIDTFILAKLEQNKIQPAKEADARTLIRRASFDLLGLPPTHQQILDFEKAYSSNADLAMEKLIDRLLQSPHYGERWGRHWLDLVRYGESNGYKADEYRPNMWRYRDWVINAFNSDMPYDQFTRHQIAGDELAPNDPSAITATGYLRLWPYESNQRDVATQWNGITDEVTDITGAVFMGLSVGCAKCHDHKFDPILHDDYYRMKSFFAGIYPDDSIVAATTEEKRVYTEKMKLWLNATTGIRKDIEKLLASKKADEQEAAVKMFHPDLQEIYAKADKNCSAWELQQKLFIQRQVDVKHKSTAKKLKGDEKKRYAELSKKLAQFDHLKPKPLTPVDAIRDTAEETPTVLIVDSDNKEPMLPGVLTLLDPNDLKITPPKLDHPSSGRRSALAHWLTRPDNQLTTRVIVNRLWYYHFGQGIVSSTNEFGKQGLPPTHPLLLDWLARNFTDNGWSLKKMHKLILTSATWRQASLVEPSIAAAENDPGNLLLWKQRVRRLEGEPIHDAMLASSQELDPTMGGEGVPETKLRRAVYQKLMRNPRTLFLNTFDGPDGFNSCSSRDITTTAPQALMMLNNRFPLQRAQTIANDLIKNKQAVEPLIDQAFEKILKRQPSSEEASQAAAFLKQQALLAKNTPPSKNKAPNLNPKFKTTAFKPFKSSVTGLPKQAVNIQPDSLYQKIEIKKLNHQEVDTFTLEAFLHLDSLYKNAEVRTIASRWNGNSSGTAQSFGWSFGITCEKSSYQPNNLIMQFTAEDIAGNPLYQVIASDLRIPVQTPYYVAAVIRTGKNGGDVTFYAQDLSKKDSPLQIVVKPHQLVAGISNPKRALVLGGRDQTLSSMFDGSIARFTLSDHALKTEELLIKGGQAKAALSDLTFTQKQLPAHLVRLLPSGPKPTSKPQNPYYQSVVDLCHSLLNSNEFLYID
ncbi:MAG: DUF1549 domain-containing protein [Verrucomicrobiales bacterium]|nr:DUF1549 domain-containing protein [Verrucomicrobiales bacterium]